MTDALVTRFITTNNLGISWWTVRNNYFSITSPANHYFQNLLAAVPKNEQQTSTSDFYRLNKLFWNNCSLVYFSGKHFGFWNDKDAFFDMRLLKETRQTKNKLSLLYLNFIWKIVMYYEKNSSYCLNIISSDRM